MYHVGNLVEIYAETYNDRVMVLQADRKVDDIKPQFLTKVKGFLHCYTAHDDFWLVELLPEDHKSGWTPSNDDVSMYSLDEGKYYTWIKPYHIVGFTSLPKTYLKCIECKTSADWADPNMTDGNFLCYLCRQNYRWKYIDKLQA